MTAGEGRRAARRPTRLIGGIRFLAGRAEALALPLKGRRLRAGFERDLQLPFNLTAPLRAYVYYAYPLGILTARGIELERFCAQYIQLVFPESKLTAAGRHLSLFRFFPQVKFEHLTALGYFAAYDWDEGRLQRPLGAVIAGLLEALASGRYLRVRANEFYLSLSPRYLRGDVRHTFLITGYDARTRSFHVPAYGPDGEFKLRQVPAMFMVQAITSLRGGTAGLFNERRLVSEIEVNTATRWPVDVAQLLAQLCDYVRGVDNSEKYLGGAFTPPQFAGIPLADSDRDDRVGAYGIRVYDSFRRYVSNLIAEGHRIDLRATRVLMEHKCMMRASLGVLARVGMIEAGTAQRYDEVLTLATRLHNIALAWYFSGEDGDGRRVYDLLDDLETAEREGLAFAHARERPLAADGQGRAATAS